MLDQKFPVRLGWLITFGLCLIPLLIWASIISLPNRFSNFSSSLTSLGQVCALVGLVLFALALIFSSRLTIWEKLFGGMNRVYIAHHIIGGTAFLFLLAHPVFIASAFLPTSAKLALAQVLPSTNWPVNFGISAILLLMSLLIFTYYTPLAYQTWRLTHKFMGLVFFLAIIHALYVPSDVLLNPRLKAYILILATVALSLHLYRTVLGRYLVKRYQYTVTAVRQLNTQVVEINLRPLKQPLIHLPGQFLFISFLSPGFTETHPFSISSPSGKPTLTITPKASGDYTSRLPALPKNTPAIIEGPFGYFTYYRYENPKQTWIAGGIGITPFYSMAKSLKPGYYIDLYYTLTNQSEAVYVNELQHIAKEYPNFKLHYWFSQTQGHITAIAIQKANPEILNSDIFLCGPSAMMTALKKQFKQLGIKSYHIHSEEFKID